MNIKGKIFKGVKEFDVIRTMEESREYTDKLKSDLPGKVKLTILIEVSESQFHRLNGLMQILHMQIEQGGYKTGFREEWGVQVEDKILPASFKHPNEVEISWAHAGTEPKKLSERFVYCSVDVIPDKDYVKNLMAV